MKKGNCYIGIDPGSSSGGICFMGDDKITTVRFKDQTEIELIDIFYTQFFRYKKIYCIIEKVHAFPGQGISSACKFCSNSGFFRGLVMGMGISMEEITPQKWMKSFGMKRAKDESKINYKKRLKQLAQQLYPEVKIVTETADAVLLAKYCKQKWT